MNKEKLVNQNTMVILNRIKKSITDKDRDEMRRIAEEAVKSLRSIS